MNALILTSRKGAGPHGDGFRAAQLDDFPLPSGTSVTDATGQTGGRIPAPNACVVEVSHSDSGALEGLLTAVRAAPAYGQGAVLHTSDNAGGKPSGTEYARLRAALAKLGLGAEALSAALGTAASGRSRADIAGSLILWLKER